MLNDRKVFVKRSQSNTKIRENIKHVIFISNLPFKVQEKDIKTFFEKEDIRNIIDILIVKDDKDCPKGFGFVEFEDEENMNKALKVKNGIIKGRAILIKKSNRNITSKSKNDLKNKRERENYNDNVGYEDLDTRKKDKFLKGFNDKNKGNININNDEDRLKDIYNDNECFMNRKDNEEEKKIPNKKKKDNDYFRKFLNK
jgi:RNA recognition motif-containing protein